LFGKVVNGTIKNLTVKGEINIAWGNEYVGGICGLLDGGEIINCTNFADIITDTST